MLELTKLPHKIEQILQRDSAIEELSRQFFRYTDFLYLGRGIHYPIALEGALKLKEISYIHAEGYPAGEMKHGPNALIDENLPVVAVRQRDDCDPASMTRYEKTISNLQEVKARDGIVVAVVTEGDTLAKESAQHTIEIPAAQAYCRPFWKLFRCNCWRTTLRCGAGATWTSPATWQSRLQSNSAQASSAVRHEGPALRKHDAAAASGPIYRRRDDYLPVTRSSTMRFMLASLLLFAIVQGLLAHSMHSGPTSADSATTPAAAAPSVLQARLDLIEGVVGSKRFPADKVVAAVGLKAGSMVTRVDLQKPPTISQRLGRFPL